MKKISRLLGLDPFVLLLFFSIFLAWIFPKPGSSTDTVSLYSVSHYGISLIFFFYGLRLNWIKIREGLFNLKLHLVVLGATFLLFPLLVLLIMFYFHGIPTAREIMDLDRMGMVATSHLQTVGTGLWLGIFFLAALPSTVSSSVVMVNIAKGNVPGAIFDASISSLLGVFFTPLWMGIFITSETGGQGLSQVLASLTFQVLVPVLLGIALHRPFGWFSEKYDSLLKKFDQTIILLIVYTSFCHSFEEEMFSGLSMRLLILLSAGMIALFFIVYYIIDFVVYFLKFNREDRITALFCGSKKSLVHGTVMSMVILGNPKLAGILILPTMIYHALQLLIVSMIANKMRKE
ncbi:MAG: bile acid:sodium symporter family protein [Planctomycetia bacterium]|nr:bile acid:sodium symporter family protein [Planctomycetia bacterium]